MEGMYSEKASVAKPVSERRSNRKQFQRSPLTSVRGVKCKRDFRFWIFFCVRWEAVGLLPE